jgi:hypothetical protein
MTTSTGPSGPDATASSGKLNPNLVLLTRRRPLLILTVAIVGVILGLGYYVAGRRPDLLIRAGLMSVKAHPLRQAYEREVRSLCAGLPALRARGLSPEEIARHLHRERRALGIRYKEMTPEPLRSHIAAVNQQRYGDPLGPSFDYLARKHARAGLPGPPGPPGQSGSIDYEAIITGACRANQDVDRLLSAPAARPSTPPPPPR